MSTIQDVYNAIDRAVPFASAMDFDNAGLLAGNPEQSVSRLLVALDITSDVIREAADCGAQLIVSHHPVIFHGLKALPAIHPVWQLASSGIGAVCAHTNLDKAPEIGVNVALAQALGLEEIETIPNDPDLLMRMGKFPVPMTQAEVVERVRSRLSCGYVQLCGKAETIQTVAVCGGAGGDLASIAKSAGADLFLTGEAKQNEWIEAAGIGQPMLVCGHHASEAVVLPVLVDYLSRALPDVDCRLTTHLEEPFQTF